MTNPIDLPMGIVSPGNEKRALEPLFQSGIIDALNKKTIGPEMLVRHSTLTYGEPTCLFV